jgi:hypothetical protein
MDALFRVNLSSCMRRQIVVTECKPPPCVVQNVVGRTFFDLGIGIRRDVDRQQQLVTTGNCLGGPPCCSYGWILAIHLTSVLRHG